MQLKRLTHRFVEEIPRSLKEGVVYVSLEYGTVVHLCCCGCGSEVVTPLSPTDWKVIYNGETVSLDPSIGNWAFDCRSHYWILNGRVRWAGLWSDEEIEIGRRQDRHNKERFYQTRQGRAGPEEQESASGPLFWERLKRQWARFVQRR